MKNCADRQTSYMKRPMARLDHFLRFRKSLVAGEPNLAGGIPRKPDTSIVPYAKVTRVIEGKPNVCLPSKEIRSVESSCSLHRGVGTRKLCLDRHRKSSL